MSFKKLWGIEIDNGAHVSFLTDGNKIKLDTATHHVELESDEVQELIYALVQGLANTGKLGKIHAKHVLMDIIEDVL